MIVQSDLLPYLVHLLNHNEIKIVTAGKIHFESILYTSLYLALRAVGNIVTGTDEQTQLVLNYGALNYFPKLLKYQKEKLNKVQKYSFSNDFFYRLNLFLGSCLVSFEYNCW